MKKKRKKYKSYAMNPRKRMWVKQHYRCLICKRQIRQNKLYSNDVNIDHIIPRYRGGTNDPKNLALVHRECNQAKGSQCPCNFYGPEYCTKEVHDFEEPEYDWPESKASSKDF